ncbi:response regulator transcription factor, partial [Bdellovibrionota bacterium]
GGLCPGYDFERGKVMAKQPIVLIAEDDQDVRMNIRLFLEANGFQCIEAVDGAETITQAKSEKPDLILLDVMMPRLNGYQVCKSLKDDPDMRSIPILILSAKAQEADIYWGERVGADGYITKPFEFEDLENQIRKLIKNG